MQLSSTWGESHDSSVTLAQSSIDKEAPNTIPVWMLYLLSAVIGIAAGSILWAMYPQILVFTKGFDWTYVKYASPTIISLVVLYIILSRSYAAKPSLDETNE